jgi:ureidoglycolate hydrolase
MEIKIRKVTSESFLKYGQIVELNPSVKAAISTEQVTFWKQQASFFIKGKTEIGVLKVKKGVMVFNELENHFITPTILIPIDGDFVMPVAGPSDKIPMAKDVEAFHVRSNQMVVLAPKVWHGATYPVYDIEITLLVIFEENALDRDTVFETLNEQCILV